MTTIAFKDGVLAADSRCTGHHIHKIKKIYRAGNALIGICGRVTSALLFVDWYAKRETPPPKLQDDDDFEAFVLTPKGLFYWDNKLREVPMGKAFAAIGTGGDFAMGAMAMGADAVEAVKVAKTLDPYTGGAIRKAVLK